jgi:curved DNA-binding protein
MADMDNFIDYYAVLQVNRHCDAKILESAYRHLAKTYHPDHLETADLDRFSQVVEAYRVLRDPASRARYDLEHGANFPEDEQDRHHAMFHPHDGSAASDAEAHEKILSLLYRRRRQSAQDAGMGSFHLQEAAACAEDHFEFHVWYLKSKGYIEVTEQGTFAITIEGVDHVITLSRAAHAEKRLIAQMTGGGE